ncbi:MAG: pyrroline-5-carboxylate reductase [Rhodobacteraceae bacterium]|nr:pyrroline-5-carboxylate reductase [Paracoccaceae bacterium]
MAGPETVHSIPEIVARKGLVLLGCGKMGGAMLEGWLSSGFPVGSVWVQDPNPSARLIELAKTGLHLNRDLPKSAAVCIIAVKPQMMGEALPKIIDTKDSSTVYLSIAAGTPITRFESILGADAAIIRAMPNTPAAIGKGITALVGNANVTPEMMHICEALLGAVGQTVQLQSEDQMDAVTAVSGSGPAYVFHLIETMAQAGITQGLPADLAMQLAKATVAGAGLLAEQSGQSPAQLRVNVTSPAGTTAAALEVLMDPQTGFPVLVDKAVKAAAERSRALRD